MLKKIVTLALSGLSMFSTAQAGVFYIGPTLSYESITTSQSISYNGVTLRPVLGYGSTLGDTAFYLGAELFGGLKPLTLNNNAKNGISLRPSYSYGVSALPGYFFDQDTLGYLRVGPIVQRFDQVGVTKTGFEVGIGLAYHFADCWNMTGEFDYMKYPSFASVSGPREGQFTLGLNYSFATV
jgi:opacity protein-like surface antigen